MRYLSASITELNGSMWQLRMPPTGFLQSSCLSLAHVWQAQQREALFCLLAGSPPVCLVLLGWECFCDQMARTYQPSQLRYFLKGNSDGKPHLLCWRKCFGEQKGRSGDKVARGGGGGQDCKQSEPVWRFACSRSSALYIMSRSYDVDLWVRFSARCNDFGSKRRRRGLR
jgi:hypothetical protein